MGNVFDALACALLHGQIHKTPELQIGPDEDGIILGFTGPDWEPTGDTLYFAQRGDKFAFGPNALAARRALTKDD